MVSRSYKRAIYQCDGPYKRFAKRYANKKVRRAKDVPANSGYKKVFDSWNISDFTVDARWGGWKSWLGRSAKKTKKGWMIPK